VVAGMHALAALGLVTALAVVLTAAERLLGPRGKVRFRELHTRASDVAVG
jgi:hypothetical protein